MRLLVLLPTAASFLLAQPTLTPSAPAVNAGQTVDITSNQTLTGCSLATGSVGSVTIVGNTVCRYTAPTGFRAKQTMYGCQILPNDHIANTRVDSLPVHANNTTWMNAMPAGQWRAGDSMPIGPANSSTPRVALTYAYSSEYDGVPMRYPNYPQLRQQGGIFSAGPGMGPNQSQGDRHVLTVDYEDCTLTEVYKRFAPGEISISPYTGKSAGSAMVYNGADFTMPGIGTNAPGLQSVAYMLRLSDFYNPAGITHAGNFVITNASHDSKYIWPAVATAGLSNPTLAPYGTRWRLKSTAAITPSGSCNTRCQGFVTALLNQGKQYGYALIDGSTVSWDMWLSPDVHQDPDVEQALKEWTSAIAWGGQTVKQTLEVVDLCQLANGTCALNTKNTNGAVNATNFNTYAGAYPSQYAEVIATSASGSTTKRVSLVAVTVGFTDDAQFITQSGITVPIVAPVVHGAGDTSVTWSVESGGGSVNTSGVYTPPSVATKTRVALRVTSNADSGAYAIAYGWVLPASSVLRLDVSSTVSTSASAAGATSTTDGSGNTWWADEGMVWGATSKTDTDYPAGLYASIDPARQVIHQFSRYAYPDWTYTFVFAPNARKRARIYFPKAYTGATASDRSEIVVDFGGQICKWDFEMHTAVDYEVRTLDCPGTTDSNGRILLGFRYRNNDPSKPNQIPRVSGVEIFDDATSPHVTLQRQGADSALTIGQQAILHALGWGMTPTVTGAVTAGTGSVAAYTTKAPDVGQPMYAVAYTAPMTPQNGSTTVTATSTVDGSQTAAASLTLQKGTLAISPDLSSMLRNNSQTFTAAINGIALPGVTWTRTAGVGSVSSSGVYQAPTYLSADAATSLQAYYDPDLSATESFTTLSVTPVVREFFASSTTGDTVTDSLGNVWSPAGANLRCNGTLNSNMSFSGWTYTGLTNVPTADRRLYAGAVYTYPYTAGTKTFQCTWPVAPGRYVVTLKLSDPNISVPNSFTMTGTYKLNGVTVLNAFNVTTAAGGVNLGIDRKFVTIVGTAENAITLELSSTGSGVIAMIGAVEISEVTTPSSLMSGRVSVSGGAQLR